MSQRFFIYFHIFLYIFIRTLKVICSPVTPNFGFSHIRIRILVENVHIKILIYYEPYWWFLSGLHDQPKFDFFICVCVIYMYVLMAWCLDLRLAWFVFGVDLVIGLVLVWCLAWCWFGFGLVFDLLFVGLVVGLVFSLFRGLGFGLLCGWFVAWLLDWFWLGCWPPQTPYHPKGGLPVWNEHSTPMNSLRRGLHEGQAWSTVSSKWEWSQEAKDSHEDTAWMQGRSIRLRRLMNDWTLWRQRQKVKLCWTSGARVGGTQHCCIVHHVFNMMDGIKSPHAEDAQGHGSPGIEERSGRRASNRRLEEMLRTVITAGFLQDRHTRVTDELKDHIKVQGGWRKVDCSDEVRTRAAMQRLEHEKVDMDIGWFGGVPGTPAENKTQIGIVTCKRHWTCIGRKRFALIAFLWARCISKTL